MTDIDEPVNNPSKPVASDGDGATPDSVSEPVAETVVAATEDAGTAVVENDPEKASFDVLRLELDQFEGPFEVLLYLIKEQEIDIFDIPILRVTEQYLQFLDMLRGENLDVAGEFLVMAATLIQIKSRMLLPVETDNEEEDEVEEEDPRLELVEKLLEYRKFRDLALLLGDHEQRHNDRFGRRVKPVFVPDDEEDDGFIEVSLYDLLKAVRSVLRFMAGDLFHRVVMEGSSVDEKVARIEVLLTERDSVSWTDLFQECRSRIELVCFLLAILELCRMRRIRAHQHAAYGEIRLFLREHDDAAPTEAAPVTEDGYAG